MQVPDELVEALALAESGDDVWSKTLKEAGSDFQVYSSNLCTQMDRIATLLRKAVDDLANLEGPAVNPKEK